MYIIIVPLVFHLESTNVCCRFFLLLSLDKSVEVKVLDGMKLIGFGCCPQIIGVKTIKFLTQMKWVPTQWHIPANGFNITSSLAMAENTTFYSFENFQFSVH